MKAAASFQWEAIKAQREEHTSLNGERQAGKLQFPEMPTFAYNLLPPIFKK